MSCWKSSALFPIAHPETSKRKQTSKLTCFLFIFLLESGDNSFKISMRKKRISSFFFLSWPSRWVQFHTLNATNPRWKRNPPQGQGGQGAMTITITITETRVDKRTTSLPLNGARSFVEKIPRRSTTKAIGQVHGGSSLRCPLESLYLPSGNLT